MKILSIYHLGVHCLLCIPAQSTATEKYKIKLQCMQTQIRLFQDIYLTRAGDKREYLVIIRDKFC